VKASGLFCAKLSLFSAPLFLLLTGCGVGLLGVEPKTETNGLRGVVHGGQQPVAGSTIQLYTVGTTGDGSVAAPMLTQTVTTDANGNFSFTNPSCTNATLVYVTAIGGDPVPGVANPNMAMMTALGPCSVLGSYSFISINELTTVAATSALAQFITSPTAIGSGSSDSAALLAAFTLASEYVNPVTGQSPGANGGAGVPVGELNTLADVMASCINSSGGVAGASNACGELFTLTTPTSGTPATDTITAMTHLASHPTLNTTALFNLVSPTAPFQPQMTTPPPDFNIQIAQPASSQAMQVGPASLVFPDTVVGTAAGAMSAYVQNISTSSMSVTNVAVTGANAGDFAITNQCTTALSSNSSCNIEVVATPAATGARNAYLAVYVSGSSTPQYVALSVNGVSAVSGSAAASLPGNFMGGTIGSTSDITLTNSGGSTLTINSIRTATPYYSATNNCGSSLAPQVSCTISVLTLAPLKIPLGMPFSSNGSGSTGLMNFGGTIYPDQLLVDTNDPLGPQVVLLENSNSLDAVLVSPSNVLFPGTTLGGGSTTSVVIGPIHVGNPTITGANAGDFSVAFASTTTASHTDTYTITFTPKAAGTRTARLNVDSVGYVPLSGVALTTAPSTQITLAPVSMSFYDFSPAQSVTLSNLSNNLVNIQSIGVTNGFRETNNCGGFVYGQSICTITVSSNQTIAGGFQGGLTVVDDLGTHTIALNSYVDQLLPMGNAAVGQTSPFGYYIDAGYPLGVPVIGNGSVSGGSASSFTVASCLGRSADCDIDLGFAPQMAGPLSGILTVSGSVWDSSAPRFLLSGTGISSGTSLTFGGFPLFHNLITPYTEPQVGYTLMIYNSGTTALNIGSANALALSGPSASEFTVSNGTCGTVAAGASCMLNFGFTPTQIGIRTATLTVTDANSGMSFNDTIMGVGEYSSLAANSVQFPNTVVNSISTMSMTVTGQTPSDPISATTTNPANFGFTKSTCARGESPCVLTVVFHPVGSGSLNGNVTVTDTRTGSTGGAYLSGTATGVGYATVSPGAVNFPLRAVGSTSIPQTLTVTNTGTAPFNISGVSLSGTSASAFVLANSCSGSLVANASCSINVSFAPVSAGDKVAALQIAGDTNANLPQTIAITGTAQ
jgi:trimeric autotransporter adhesin